MWRRQRPFHDKNGEAKNDGKSRGGNAICFFDESKNAAASLSVKIDKNRAQ